MPFIPNAYLYFPLEDPMRDSIRILEFSLLVGCVSAGNLPSPLHLTEDDGPVAEARWPQEGFAIVTPSADPQRPPVISRRGRGACHFMPSAEPRYAHDVAVRFAATDPGVYGVRLFSSATGTQRLVAEGTIAVDRTDDAICYLFFPPRQHATFDLVEVVRIELTCATSGTCAATNTNSVPGALDVSEDGVNRRTDPVPNGSGFHQSIVLP